MKKRYLLLLLIACAFFACNDDNSTGMVILPLGDKIPVCSDTFHVQTANYHDMVISAASDTMILGYFYSPKYGSTRADLLVQLAAPEGYEFPPAQYNPQPDSLVLLMYYNSWFGSAYTPFEVSIYELNKEKIDYTTRYLSNINPDDFTDKSILMGKRLATSIDQTRLDKNGKDSASVPYIRYKFSQEQLERFYSIPQQAYNSTDEFLNHFGGMYITTSYGSSTMLHLQQVTLYLYYHYTYQRNGKDTVVNTSIAFPANKEVRQLNRFEHDNIAQAIENCPDSVVYIKSAAGVYPKVTVPIGRMAKEMNSKIGKNKQLQINGATLIVEGIAFDDNDVFMDPPVTLMAITADEFDDFLHYYQLPESADRIKTVATYSIIDNSYSFDIDYYLTKQLRQSNISPDQTLDLMLVPVEITRSTSGSVTRIRPQNKLCAITVRSSSNEYSPMKLRLLYSGF